MRIPDFITEDMVIDAVAADDNLGFCIMCGAMAHGVEPDAQKYKCPECGEHFVYGAEEILVHIAV